MERELLLECQRGDRNAQRKVYEKMAGRLYSVCKRYLKNDEDIEEVLADTFYKIFTKVNQLQNPDTFEAWAKKIAVNECLQKLRSNKDLLISLEEGIAEPSEGSSEHLSFEKDILSLLNFLPEGCRAIFNLFAIEGYPHKEISYLQSELLDVLRKVETNLENSEIRYGSVFYRDKGDEYITRKFDFSDKAENLIQFIKQQKAAGGGDTPEAVVEALQVYIDELTWRPGNSTKIMFLILDALPHQSQENIQKLYDKIKKAAQKGITIIPLAASDTNKETEYLMRTFALLTKGTYTFLTNDSGIGNNHIKPTIDSYEVEKLNSLLLRLILQKATLPECTKGMIKIRTAHKIEELYIYDLAGKIIMRKENLEEGKNTIDMTSYPQGIYLVRIQMKSNWETFKVIKN